MEPGTQAHDWIRLVRIETSDALLEGELALPPDPRGLVVFVHGSGSSRLSPRNRYVSMALRSSASVGTLLFDLLTESEERRDAVSGELRFDIDFLARRVVAVTDWATRLPDTGWLPIGYFGASTGAAAALTAAVERPDDVAAIVSRGGRPDLVSASDLAKVQAPTLFIVGGEDYPVIEWNRAACAAMRAPAQMEVIPGASHLFEEPGALEEVARRASAWFRRFLEGKRAAAG
jgi:putative phosphoribosyl transferase